MKQSNNTETRHTLELKKRTLANGEVFYFINHNKSEFMRYKEKDFEKAKSDMKLFEAVIKGGEVGDVTINSKEIFVVVK